MSVRAKFVTTKITISPSSKTVVGEDGVGRSVACEFYTIEACPVYHNGDKEHENYKYWQSSPSGAFSIGTVNEAAAAQYKIGQEFYLDCTPCIAPA